VAVAYFISQQRRQCSLNEELQSYALNAIAWAKARLGSRDYPLRCLAFVEDAYEKANNVEIFGSDCASGSAVLYGAAENKGLPPAGTFVFYACGGPVDGVQHDWGHVGMSLGDGKVIHAWGVVRIDDYLDIEKLEPLPGWTYPEYIGWAPIERIFRGYIKK
jgi:cell wall-associated NlpC family hydrolase